MDPGWSSSSFCGLPLENATDSSGQPVPAIQEASTRWVELAEFRRAGFRTRFCAAGIDVTVVAFCGSQSAASMYSSS